MTAKKPQHAELSGSIAHRWIPCPGSIRLTRGVERKRGAAARLGTAAHALGDQVLKYWKKTGEGIKGLRQRFKADHAFVFDDHGEDGIAAIADDDMLDAVFVRIQYVLDQRATPANVHTELHVSLERIVRDNMYGTADDVVEHHRRKLLVVNDYKHGFIPVRVGTESEPNAQLMYYAAGALDKFNWHHADVELSIIQPRSMEVDPIQMIHVKAKHVREWATETLYAAAHATDDPKAPLVAGEWCRFCPALDDCPAARSMVTGAAGEDFAELAVRTKEDLPPVPRDPKDLSRVLKAIPIIKAWSEACQEKALEVLTAGTVVPGFTLVPKRTHRKWPEGIGSIGLAKRLHKAGARIAPHELMAEPKLISPAQLSKIIDAEIVNKVAVKPDGGNAVAADDSDDFKELL